MKYLFLFILLTFITICRVHAQIIIDHHCTEISAIPPEDIMSAKATLHIAYGHTSHGSQLVSGMTGLIPYANTGGSGLKLPMNIFSFNNGGSGGTLDLHDQAMAGDVGYYPDWVNNTRTYLGAPNKATGRGTGIHADVNVIVWSWCGQAASQTEATMISNYLTPMTQLENDYPGIKFVYMTGHLDGTGAGGNLHARNEQIRNYCRINKKILYDFADIESFDPDGQANYMLLKANDNCDYDSDSNGSRDKNWAVEWQNSHKVNVEWYACSTAHSQSLNGNLKGFAAWHLWARLANWEGLSGIHGLDIETAYKIYPNPFTQKLIIETKGNSKDYALLNVFGQIVIQGTVSGKTTIQTGNLASGLYLVKFGNNTYHEYSKIIKE